MPAARAAHVVEAKDERALLLEEEDVDILAWAMGWKAPPAKYDGPLLEALKKLDFVTI